MEEQQYSVDPCKAHMELVTVLKGQLAACQEHAALVRAAFNQSQAEVAQLRATLDEVAEAAGKENDAQEADGEEASQAGTPGRRDRGEGDHCN